MKKYYIQITTLGHLVNDASTSVLPALLPLFISTYELTLTQAGILIFANTALASILQPILGYLSDKLSEPRFIALGVLLSSGSIGMMGLVHSYPALIACSIMAGVGSAIFHPEGAKIINRLSGIQKGKSMGTFAIGGSAGFALGPIIAAAIAYSIGLKGLLAYSICGLIMAIILFLIMPHMIAHADSLQVSIATEEQAKSGVLLNNWKSFGILFLVILAQSVNFSVLHTFIPVYWIQVLGQTPESGSFALTVFFSIGIIMTYLGGIYADRIGLVRMVKFSFFLWLPAIILFPQTTTLWLAYPAIIIIGTARALTYSPVVVLGQTYLAKSVGFASGITFGLTMTIGGMFSPIVGKLADMYGLPIALHLLIPFMIIGLIASFLLPEPKKQRV